MPPSRAEACAPIPPRPRCPSMHPRKDASAAAVELSDPPDPTAWGVLTASLDRYNEQFVGPSDFRPLVLVVRDPAGAVTGGLWGRTMYRWLWVWHLVLPEGMRRQGLGTRLMRAAAAEATARGCLGAMLDTFSFQAPGFYRRLGYEVFGTVEDMPPGHHVQFMKKRLVPDSAPGAITPTGQQAAERADGE